MTKKLLGYSKSELKIIKIWNRQHKIITCNITKNWKCQKLQKKNSKIV